MDGGGRNEKSGANVFFPRHRNNRVYRWAGDARTYDVIIHRQFFAIQLFPVRFTIEQ